MAQRNLELVGPYELLDLYDGESMNLEISSFQKGVMTIHPKYAGAPAEKTIPVLRVHVKEVSKQLPPMYYDITSKTLIAQIEPHLLAGGFEARIFKITRFGTGPRTRYRMELLMAQ